jgi:hypothetical protein
MLNMLALLAGETSGLIQFIIVVVILGGVCYIVSILPINQIFKTVIYVVAAIVLFIYALRTLLPMAGL